MVSSTVATATAPLRSVRVSGRALVGSTSAYGAMSTLHLPTVRVPRAPCSIAANVQSFSANETGPPSRALSLKSVQMSESGCENTTARAPPMLRSVVMAVLLPRVQSTQTDPGGTVAFGPKAREPTVTSYWYLRCVLPRWGRLAASALALAFCSISRPPHTRGARVRREAGPF